MGTKARVSHSFISMFEKHASSMPGEKAVGTQMNKTGPLRGGSRSSSGETELK